MAVLLFLNAVTRKSVYDQILADTNCTVFQAQPGPETVT